MQSSALRDHQGHRNRRGNDWPGRVRALQWTAAGDHRATLRHKARRCLGCLSSSIFETWSKGSETLRTSGRAVWCTGTQERYRKRPGKNGEEAQKEMLNHWKAFIGEKRGWRENTAAFKGKNVGAHASPKSVRLLYLLLLVTLGEMGPTENRTWRL